MDTKALLPEVVAVVEIEAEPKAVEAEPKAVAEVAVAEVAVAEAEPKAVAEAEPKAVAAVHLNRLFVFLP